jgi:hypothetical protein
LCTCEEVEEKLKLYQSKTGDTDTDISLIAQGFVALCRKEYNSARNIFKQGKCF